MASYRAYVYCDKCKQPLRKNEYRREVSANGQSVSVTYYCRICNSLARKPFSMAMWVFVILLTFLSVWAATDLLSEPSETLSQSRKKTFNVFVIMALTVGYFAVGWCKKSKCKPIYDRWVHNYGSDFENWPDAPRLYRTPEKSKSPKSVQITVLIIGIVVAMLIWYVNYKSGLF